MAGDDFYNVALDRAEERNPIYTTNDELAQSRRAKSSLAHVDLNIEQLENPLKDFGANFFSYQAERLTTPAATCLTYDS